MRVPECRAEGAESAGMLGLLFAARQWDEGRQVTFMTYAHTAIHSRIRRDCTQDLEADRQRPVDDDGDHFDIEDHRQETPDQAAERAERIEMIEAALRKMRPGRAKVIRLRFLHGISCQKIAPILGISPARVHQIAVAGIKDLRRRLPAQMGEMAEMAG